MAKGRVLVLSNAALSLSDSNGRTVSMLLNGYKPEQLAQFCTYGNPNFSLCDNFYRVTDGDALNSFVKRVETGGRIEMKCSPIISDINKKKKRRRTPLSMIIREFVWRYGCWSKSKLWSWVDEFRPDVVFVNLADNAFLPRLAIKIAKRKKIPVVVFSTEEYVFKKYNYITKRPSLFYKVFHHELKAVYKKLSRYVIKGYFNTPLLRDAYEEEYSFPCYVAMNSSDISWVDRAEVVNNSRISYLGNLGINRHIPLLEIAEALSQIRSDLVLDVYGKIPNEAVSEAFGKCSNIRYHGFVSYSEVKKIIHNSSLLVHAESQDDFYIRDLRYAFSTKIADSVSSGTPLLVYANRTMAAMDFVTKNECAFVCTSSDELLDVLQTALSNVGMRRSVLKKAKEAKEVFFSGNEIDLLEIKR